MVAGISTGKEEEIAMKIYSKSLRWLTPAIMALLVSDVSEVFAQARPTAGPRADFQIKRIETRAYNPRGGSGESGRGGSEAGRVPWKLFECEFDSQPEWADEVEVKWYVLMAGKQQTLATGTDSYVYVKRGRRHVAGMLMHPLVMERWMGTTSQASLDVGVEIWVQGRLWSFDDTKHTRKQWWQQFTPQAGLLMRIDESPFMTTLYADYEWSKYTTSKRQ